MTGSAIWLSDRELTSDIVVQVIRDQFPDLGDVTAEFIDDGFDNDAYLINDDYIFRFPKRKNIPQEMRKEISLLLRLNFTEFDIAIPKPEYTGVKSSLFPYMFSGYKKLEGIFGFTHFPDKKYWPIITKQLGDLLSKLHGEYTDQFYEKPIENLEQAEYDLLVNRLESVVKKKANIEKLTPPELLQHYQHYLDGTFSKVKEYDGKHILLHGDLHSEHIMLNEEGSKVTGIIDWMDCQTGDPTKDFSGIYRWMGNDFTQEVLKNYQHEIDNKFMDRLVLRSHLESLNVIGYGNEKYVGVAIEELRTMLSK